MSIHNIIDTFRYPIDDSGGARYKKLISRCRQQLEREGCCLLPEFLRPSALDNAKRRLLHSLRMGSK